MDTATNATIRVDTAGDRGAFRPVWAWFGYDEPNYSTMPYGKKLLRELAALRPNGPVYIRVHNLLTTGDGTAALKWGSTNAYTEDGDGNPIYDWTILDNIFDTFREAGVKPLVQIGFMPEALSTRPHPYRHEWPRTEIWTGWTYPPKDYAKWAGLVYEWARHLGERYGIAEASSWPWEVWNEPDIRYWQGTDDEFFALYDHAAHALHRALPNAKIGGPDSTGGGTAFLRRFLTHCNRGTNYATGQVGSPLDYVLFHPKGHPRLVDGHVQMGMDAQLRAIRDNFAVIAEFPAYRNTPVILGESDPEGCAACSVEHHPQNAYRDGTLYGAYTTVVLDATLDLAAEYGINLLGMVTWAFEFEGEPFFAGFRELATNGIDKPVLNAFRMFSRLQGVRLPVTSAWGATPQAIIAGGVRGPHPLVHALATRHENTAAALVVHYHDDDLPTPDVPVRLTFENLPGGVTHVRVRHYRVDGQRGNSYEVWKAQGRPQTPTPDQYEFMERVGQAVPEVIERYGILGNTGDRALGAGGALVAIDGGTLAIDFGQPYQGLSLVTLEW